MQEKEKSSKKARRLSGPAHARKVRDSCLKNKEKKNSAEKGRKGGSIMATSRVTFRAVPLMVKK